MAKVNAWVVLALGSGMMVLGILVGTTPPVHAGPNPTQVEVTNTPLHVSASQRGTWSVGISGTPTVQVAPSQIFRARLSAQADSSPEWTNNTARLAVVEVVSASYEQTDPHFSVLTFLGTISIDKTDPLYSFAGNVIGPDPATGLNNYALSTLTRIYVQPGETLNASTTNGTVTLSGHYE